MFAVTSTPKAGFLGKRKKKKIKDAEGNQVFPGCLEAWSQKRSGVEIHNYVSLWVVNVKENGQCLWWCTELNMICMGCEKGTIVVYRLNPKSPLKKVEHINEKIHKDKVMGIWVDEDKQMMFSVSEDKNLICYDLKNKNIESSKVEFEN
jgi:WD40 repeat protein